MDQKFRNITTIIYHLFQHECIPYSFELGWLLPPKVLHGTAASLLEEQLPISNNFTLIFLLCQISHNALQYRTLKESMR
jgi:hypothetical protein